MERDQRHERDGLIECEPVTISGTWDTAPTVINLRSFTLHIETRRFLWWTVARSEYVFAARVVSRASFCDLSIEPTEAPVERLRPFVERAAFAIARIWTRT